MKDINQSGKFREISINQKQTWSKGDFNEIARQNVLMAESLCQYVDPLPGQKVLDIACGSGTAALVAARRYCEVTGIDYVPELIKRATKRAEASGLKANFRIADAQELPFPDDSFDVVLSVYGVQFAPDQEKAASEMLRVCRPGGKIGLASPIPEGWSGDFFCINARYFTPPPGIKPPLRWGTDTGLNQLLGQRTESIESKKQKTLQYYLSVEHALNVFSTWFGPTLQALEKLDEKQQENLLNDLNEVFNCYNRSTNGTAIIENRYLQSIAYNI
ncbi:MAG: methyltransferase domain-containing protein [Balneolales bacterium]